MSELDRIKRELCNFSSKFVLNSNESVALNCCPVVVDDKTKIARTFLAGIGFSDAIEQLLCVIRNLKVAVTNDHLQCRQTPAVNTVKLASQLLCSLENNPYIRYCRDSTGLPVKYFIFLNPICQKSGFRPGKELVSQEIVAIDKCCRQYSIISLSVQDTVYIPDPVDSCDPTVTYLKALNRLEQFLKVSIRANCHIGEG